MKDPSEGVASLYVPAFDGIRGLVSLSIALIHVQLAVRFLPGHEALRSLRASWYFSIEFLFLLGGFVACLPLVYYGRFAGIRSYAIRRAGRILPLGENALPVGLIALTSFRPGGAWAPQRRSAGQGALALLANTVAARRRPDDCLRAVRAAAEGALVLESERGEADEAAPSLLAALEGVADPVRAPV